MPAGKLRWCYANANRCWRWASESTSYEHRQAFLDMAGMWRAMALEEARRSTQTQGPVLRSGYRTKPSAPNQLRSSGLSEINVSVEAA
jgi:hypothetical protein